MVQTSTEKAAASNHDDDGGRATGDDGLQGRTILSMMQELLLGIEKDAGQADPEARAALDELRLSLAGLEDARRAAGLPPRDASDVSRPWGADAEGAGPGLRGAEDLAAALRQLESMERQMDEVENALDAMDRESMAVLAAALGGEGREAGEAKEGSTGAGGAEGHAPDGKTGRGAGAAGDEENEGDGTAGTGNGNV